VGLWYFPFYSELKNRILNQATVGEGPASLEELKEVKDIVEDVEEFTKEMRILSKAKGQNRAPYSKYKGKEIISLLSENNRQALRSITHDEPREPVAVKEEEAPGMEERGGESVRDTTERSTSPVVAGCYPFWCFSDPMLGIQSMFRPCFAPAGGLLFSGRQSSFSCLCPGWEAMSQGAPREDHSTNLMSKSSLL
jgi:hypothetical protein